MFTDMFGNRCEICPACGKITVEVKMDVAYLCCPPRPQVQQRCGCGWAGDPYPGEPEAGEEALWLGVRR